MPVYDRLYEKSKQSVRPGTESSAQLNNNNRSTIRNSQMNQPRASTSFSEEKRFNSSKKQPNPNPKKMETPAYDRLYGEM
mmetsp:Transcript_33030/g.29935  ORF Transcript_33030/g.29935 Transcript_33030/m.29935 type:complete len:80 (+) Transcript_33030:310-549(+)